MNRLKIGDDVIVLAGKDKGKRGSILRIVDEARVLVNDVNLIKKHVKPNPNKGDTGGIVEREASIHISNIALFNPISKKADRVGFKKLEDGRKVRIFKSSGEAVDVS
ncbi:MAG: 50S ribosomal protein L24 [Arenicellales bacterium WSBS_2016_MAG_OTU3]